MADFYKHNYPIETDEAVAFWASNHKCNRMKAIIAFSFDLQNANINLRREGYSRFWRLRALNNFGMYVDRPSMSTLPYSMMDTPWWECMPYDPVTPPPPTSCIWVDDDVWVDTDRWAECL